ncbi:hypothetical protein PGAAJM_06180 [Kocuria varians]
MLTEADGSSGIVNNGQESGELLDFSLHALKFLLAPPLSEGPVSQVLQGFPYPDDTLKNRHCE